jgi:hypothetical protein
MLHASRGIGPPASSVPNIAEVASGISER